VQHEHLVRLTLCARQPRLPDEEARLRLRRHTVLALAEDLERPGGEREEIGADRLGRAERYALCRLGDGGIDDVRVRYRTAVCGTADSAGASRSAAGSDIADHRRSVPGRHVEKTFAGRRRHLRSISGNRTNEVYPVALY
jgi:hypothetical protein